MQIPSVVDPSIVPPGKHLLSCWVTYAPVQSPTWWAEHGRAFGEIILDEVGRYTPNLREVIEEWTIITPADIERRMGMTDGNIRHIDMTAGQMLDARPAPGYRSYGTPVSGLYLCGSGSHPGGEITGAPGHNAAQFILDQL
jgi:phytoene dehydrogenase-like protein